ncbi:hypothetical protein TDMWS_19520 [Thermodesulfomicrobium sp. WS]|uniref:EAL domain-containing protein n=1 Tax=Thermodesulfomicrobium sp. WS TaxID=3004129 RepID=UPI00248F93A1|nr:EAL domain-containing protein [Thermodesulfomicrobium sp. WS]BDV01867.1 hypothetical protein TDMWS_19520 [Thermodesulfomicrobium sp. WS]
MHRLLARQLRDLGLSAESLDPKLAPLAEAVSNAYFHLEEEIALQTQSLRLATQELAEQSQRLSETQERLSRIIEFLPDPTMVIDHEGRVQAWNRAMEALTHVPAVEILGKGGRCYAIPFYGYTRPILVDLLLDPSLPDRHQYPELHEEEDLLTAEVFAPALRQGAGAFVWARAILLRDSSGKVAGAIESVRDITSHKRDIVRARILYELSRHTTDLGSLDALPQAVAGVLSRQLPLTDVALRLRPENEGERFFCQGAHSGFAQRARAAMDQAESLGRSTEAALLADGWVMAAPLPATAQFSGAVALCLSQAGRLLAAGGLLDQVADQLTLAATHLQLQEQLAATQDKFQQLFDNAPLGILMLDPQGQPQAANAAFLHLFGLKAAEVAGAFAVLVDEANQAQHAALVQRALAGANVHVETSRRHRMGHSIDVAILGYPYLVAGRVAGAFFLYQDISQRKRYEEELAYQALHDQLTGLPNRTLFLDRLSQALARRQRRFAAMMLDLDDFKRVNDTLGHAAGDTLLEHIARVLSQAVRAGDTVARLGGDEFAILLADISSPRDAVPVIRRILRSMNQPVDLEGHAYQPATSIGVVLNTDGYTSADEVLRDADIAMYHAKNAGKNRFKVFTRRMYAQVMQDMQMENHLRAAIENGGLSIHFQPIVQVADGGVVGLEGLVRWQHPQLGPVPPATFVPLAEKANLITQLTQWMLRTACRIFASWRKQHPQLATLFLSLNLSAQDLAHPNLVTTVLTSLREAHMPPSCLKLEITETAIMRHIEQASHKLHRLRQEGVGVCMDDFGTGYSSLSYLRRLPVDTLKIDRSFVNSMLENPSNREIVRVILGLAQVLRLTTVAEGVETRAQLDALHQLGCPLAQGYCLGRPMDAEAALTFLLEHAAQDPS